MEFNIQKNVEKIPQMIFILNFPRKIITKYNKKRFVCLFVQHP